ncbi:Histidine--tRNA ligase [Aphelenchoides fujianensis]|nr:Histidine--tRNA ligase [Aphelenchoides fujianensis]
MLVGRAVRAFRVAQRSFCAAELPDIRPPPVVYTQRSGRRIKAQMAKAAAKKAAGETKLQLKTPKGTRDFGLKQTYVREQVIDVLKEIFRKHGAGSIETPVFELREILMGKYGEEGGKLVYDLADQGGEACSLRYDLTVPFARYVAMNKITNIKRYQIAKVYRRDQPVMTKGRYREFYQCDFDIAGQYASMVPDAEVLKIADEVMRILQLGAYEIRLNHRALLEGIFELAGVAEKDFKTVSSSIDKLDKVEWAEVERELVDEKKIDRAAVEKLKEHVLARLNGTDATNEQLLERFASLENPKVKTAVEELQLLLKYCRLYECHENVVFEPSLARGLDYYTGAIYEVVVTEFSFSTADPAPSPANSKSETPEESGPIGSLVGMFMETSGKKKPADVPCVGISFGVERLFTIMELKQKAEEHRTSFTQVYVASAGKDLRDKRMELTATLWKAGIRAEHSDKPNPKPLDQYQYCEKNGIPWIVMIGESELERGVCKVRDVKSKEEIEVEIRNVEELLDQRLKLA